MPIEFACPGCDAYLRVADGKAGLRIRCPVCQEPAWVPHSDRSEDVQRPNAEEAAPASVPNLNSHETPASERPLPDRVSLAQILVQTWQIYTANLPRCVMAGVLDLVATVTGLTIALLLAALSFVLLHRFDQLALAVAICVLGVTMTVTFSAIAVGNFRYYLAMARGQAIAPRLIGRDLAVGRLIAGWSTFWLLSGLGFMLFVLPGLVIMMLLWPFAAVIVDRHLPAGAALREASRMTRGNLEAAVWVFLVHLLLLALGFVPVAGQLVAIPLASVFHSVSYLHLSGEITTPQAGPKVCEERENPRKSD